MIATRGYGAGSISAVVLRGFDLPESGDGIELGPAPSASIATRGYGSGGSIAGLVLRGFGAAESVPVITAPGLEFTMPISRLHYHFRDEDE